MSSDDDSPGLPNPTVFISYAHDDEVHKDLVVEFATLLRVAGVDARLDLWNDGGRQDWSLWAVRELTDSDFVLVIGSPEYRRRAEGLAPPGEGRGVWWEARAIRDRLYRGQEKEFRRILPVVLPGRSVDEIPTFLAPFSGSLYEVPELTLEGIGTLLRCLLGIPSRKLPELGTFAGLSPVSDSTRPRRAMVQKPALTSERADGKIRFRRLWAPVAVLILVFFMCASSVAVFEDDADSAEDGLASTPVGEYADTYIERTRGDILAAAATWMEAPVMFSPNPELTLGGYRPDSAGFVSMAWGLKAPGLTIRALTTMAHRITKEQLKPGDVLVRRATPGAPGHVVIFERWADTSESSYVAFEQPSSGTARTAHRVIPYPYDDDASHYVPYSYRNAVDGAVVPSRPANHGLAAFLMPDGRLGYVQTAGGKDIAFTRQRKESQGWTTTALSLGLTAVGTPAVLVDQQNMVSVITRTGSNSLVHALLDEGGFSKIVMIDKKVELAGDPATAFDPLGRHNYVVRSQSDSLRQGSENRPGSEQWSEWEMVTGVSGEPTTAMDAWHRQHYLARTEFGKLVHGWLTPTDSWHHTLLPVDAAGDPVLILDQHGSLHYFVRSGQSTLLHGWQTLPGTGPWATETLAPDIAGDPATVLARDGTLSYMARTQSGALIYSRQSPTGGWTQPSTVIASGVVGNPSIICGANGGLVYFVRSSTGHVLYGSQANPDSQEWQPPVPI